MATQFDGFEEVHRNFIAAQHIFFVGTAAAEGRVNISPKGMDSLVVDGSNRVLWRNLTGSGNETAGHLLDTNRMTLMWCGFEGRPMILRAYGRARAVYPDDADWDAFYARFEPIPGARQIFDMTVEMVQSSCGYAVPFMDYVEDRRVLEAWAIRKGEDGLRSYWAEANTKTIDGFPTGIVNDDA